jgi:nucleotidyltransferase substrate binding protein (TIGR01987 family)
MPEISLSRIQKALATLDKGFKPDPTDLERDGIIQRFEYCLELCWKVSKRVLEAAGVPADSPKNVFRELARLGWVSAPDSWLRFLEARNKTSHLYNEDVAAEIFAIVPEFMREAKLLVAVLAKKIG